MDESKALKTARTLTQAQISEMETNLNKIHTNHIWRTYSKATLRKLQKSTQTRAFLPQLTSQATEYPTQTWPEVH
jgi:hypothetical protein